MTDEELRATMLQAILSQGVSLVQAVQDAEAAIAYVRNGPPKEADSMPPKRGPKRTSAIIDMWASGLSAAAIGKKMNIKRQSVYSAICRARANNDLRAGARCQFSDEQRASAGDRMRAVTASRRQVQP